MAWLSALFTVWPKPAFPVLPLTTLFISYPSVINDLFIIQTILHFLDAKSSPYLLEGSSLCFLHIQIIHILADEAKIAPLLTHSFSSYLNSYSNYRITHLSINYAFRFLVYIWLPCWFISGIINSAFFWPLALTNMDSPWHRKSLLFFLCISLEKWFCYMLSKPWGSRRERQGRQNSSFQS